ncbi:zinc finger protein 85-like putative protein [Pseudoloma neurophilia]|uniref:Uncharacterized protein n=1 Tax=Pseudoloma neurophilia TaxID=146866 RepID=A0A0R0M303_9MICR|nr:zinc finger protein 85-like putative protein [Pseudoloma neurophilia]
MKKQSELILVPRKTFKSIKLPEQYGIFKNATINDYQVLMVVIYCEKIKECNYNTGVNHSLKSDSSKELKNSSKSDSSKEQKNSSKSDSSKELKNSSKSEQKNSLKSDSSKELKNSSKSEQKNSLKSDSSKELKNSSKSEQKNSLKSDSSKELKNSSKSEQKNSLKSDSSKEQKSDSSKEQKNSSIKSALKYLIELINFSSQQRHEHKFNGLKCLVDCLKMDTLARVINLTEKSDVVNQNVDNFMKVVHTFIKECLNCKFIGNKSLTECFCLLECSSNFDSNNPMIKDMIYLIMYQIRKKEAFSLIKHYFLKNGHIVKNIVKNNGRIVKNNGHIIQNIVKNNGRIIQNIVKNKEHIVKNNESLVSLIEKNNKKPIDILDKNPVRSTLIKILLSSDDWLFKKRLIDCLVIIDWKFAIFYIEQVMDYMRYMGILEPSNESKSLNGHHKYQNGLKSGHRSDQKSDKKYQQNIFRLLRLSFQSLSKRDTQLILDTHKYLILRNKDHENVDQQLENITMDDLPFLLESKRSNEMVDLFKRECSRILDRLLNESHEICAEQCKKGLCLLKSVINFSIRNNPKIIKYLIENILDWRIVKLLIYELKDVDVEGKLRYWLDGQRKVLSVERILQKHILAEQK